MPQRLGDNPRSIRENLPLYSLPRERAKMSQKVHKKPLDKSQKIWYNIYVIKREHQKVKNGWRPYRQAERQRKD